MDTIYDVIVIGSGPAGFSVLEQIAHKGLKIALVENRKLGGACPNFACVPTKALIKCAHELSRVRRADNFGVIGKDVGFDWKKVQTYREEKIAGTAAQDAEEYLKEKEIDLLWGTARFVSPYEIDVDGRKYKADKFAITTGSRARIPDVQGIQEVGVLDSDEAVELQTLPKSLAIIGAGATGIEIAQMFARFGVKVTVITHSGRILTNEDMEIAKMAQHYLTHDQIQFVFNAEMKQFTKEANAKRIHLTVENKEQMIEAEAILMAIGRTPNIDMLNLEKTGILFSKKGIKVNDYMQTSQPHMYAAGDNVGILLFTHNASYEGGVIGRNLLGENIKADHRVIPRGTFIDPEIGSVGLMEREAKEKGYHVVNALAPYSGGRGGIESTPEGLIKVTVDAKTRQILGASVIGHMAAEFVHLLALAMYSNIPIDTVDTMVYAFPTYAEGLAGITAYLKE